MLSNEKRIRLSSFRALFVSAIFIETSCLGFEMLREAHQVLAEFLRGAKEMVTVQMPWTMKDKDSEVSLLQISEFQF
ncbi:hypothetical protein L596_021286 [Steinernema carpocapsae]|uniref:Uncharacterized protein n=1 Tax=Steinernema carpocapsae TaxID=34508 RepID=A0A4U5MI79_STECR|nr:hypothetical protein L596_021286 [Steinernema carpocapsae]